VSSSTASVLLLYATGLYFSTQQGESEVHPSLSVDILNNQKYLQALDKAMVTTAPRSNDKTSSMAYLDALEFVCKVLLQQVNAVWKSFSDGEAIHYSGNMDYVLTALHRFIDSSFAAYSCTKMSEGDNERLHEQRRTLLRVLVLVIKVSFITNKDVQKSLDSINRAISSKWLMLEELKFLISSLGNIGVTLHNTGHFKEALKALELCCQTIWAYVELSYCTLSSRTEGNGIIEDLPKDTLNDIVLDGFARIEKMVNTLHRCGSKNTREIVVKSLSKLLAYGTVSEYFNSSLILIKLWVKTTCKDFENNKGVDSAPLLYNSLLGCPSPLPKELIGLIVEQESLAYGLMEARGSVFSAEMQMRVINILLDEIYCSKECFRERSRVLVRKAGALRARGVQNISSCLDTLSEAISLLEGNLGGEVIFENARRALSLWSRVESFHHSDPGMVLQQPSRTIVPLLCSLVDLLSMKGCFELQFKLCEVMIMIWKQENLPLEKLMSLLMLHSDLFIPQSCEHSFGRQFSFDAGVDEVREVALSLVSEDTSNDQSTFLAGYLYYDLSERLLSCGLLFQAFSHGKEALDLRKKLLKRKFKLNSGVSANTKSQHCGQDLVSLEAWGPAIAEIWPDCSRSTSARDSFLTPWNVLRCYLESTLQVAMMHELIGNGTEAEILLRTGKEISDFHGLSVFCIAFTSLLGQLYRKRYLCDEADSELKYARDLLVENDAIISCKPCKLTMEISVDMQDGDLSWSLFEKDCQEQSGKKELSSALGKYQSAINKWNSTDLKFCTGSSDSCKTGCPVCNKDCIIPIKHEACNQGKEFLTSKDGVLPPCSVCVLLRQASVHHCNESTKLKALRKNLRNAEASPPLDVKAKRTSRNSSRLAKEHIVETHAKTIIRSSKRNAHLKGAKASTELNSKNGTSWSDELPKDALVCGEDCYRTYEPHLVGLIVDGSTGDFLPFERAEILRSMSFFLLKGSLSEQSRDVCCSLFNVKLSDVVPWLLKAFVLSRESPSLFQESTLADFRSGMDGDVSKSLRYPSMDIEYIEKHITEFFQKLPDVPVVCVSMLGGDYANVIAKFVLDPSYFPAWMLLSRFDSTGEPTTMLLPVDAISGSQSEDSSIKDLGNPIGVLDKKWQCPWGYAITDYVAPTFKKILDENFVSLSSATLTINDVHADHVRWWSHRMKLNNCLDNMLKDMEESWFGPWKCLLLGHQLSDQHMEAALSEVDFKANPTLIKAILGGAVSVDEVQECVYQLVLYKGYFGRGGCCGKDRLRGFSCQIEDEALEALTYTIKNAANELPKPVDRDPIILVLDINVQMLPWENLPVLRNQEIYRMPSMTSIFLALSRSNNLRKDGSVMAPPFPVIDPFNTFYLLNPSGDLSSTQEEFDQLFRNYDWKGKAGDPPPEAGELAVALTNHDLFLYFGHGSGTQYVSGKEIEKLNNCAAALLMGCSSGTLHCKGSYAPRGAPLSYLSAGSPAIIANLWDVSDKDIDRFSKALLDSWLQENFADGNICSNCCQLTQEFEAMKIASKENGRTRRKGTRGKRPQQINNSTKSCSCRQRRIASYLSEARRACRLQLLIGASPVCYGVPTIIRKKVTTDSATGDER
uniref:separase n=1 Tax=Setaria italica TaxID=4555 RepID=K3Z105_SETIT